MKIAKLFQNGQSQAVRLPKEFRLNGKEVFIKKVGETIVLIPKNHPWSMLMAGLKHFSKDINLERNQQKTHQIREELFK